jgi:hypothetical protein
LGFNGVGRKVRKILNEALCFRCLIFFMGNLREVPPSPSVQFEVYRATLLAERVDYPFKYLYNRKDCFEIVMLNESKQQFPISLKIFCEDGTTKREDIQLKIDTIYRSIPKSVAPWDVS